MANSIQLPDNPDIANKILDNQKEKDLRNTEIGWLGKVWGVSSSVPNNIAAFTIIFFLIVGSVISCRQSDLSGVKGVWNVFVPLISLAFGYLFGDKNAHKKQEV